MNLFIRLTAAVIFTLAAGSVPAQFAPGAGDMPGLDQALRKLFEKVEGFTSQGVMIIGGGGQNAKLTVAISMLNGDTRTEVDLAKMEGAPIPPEMIKQLAAVGMDKMVTVSYAKDARSLMIYPGMKAYAEISGAKTADGKAPDCTMKKSVIGAEDVGGKMCEKSVVEIQCEGSTEVKLTVWTEKSGRKLPVKIATSQDGVSLTMEFKDFKEIKPDAKVFAEPGDFKKYNSVEELMTANMQKLMQAAPAK